MKLCVVAALFAILVALTSSAPAPQVFSDEFVGVAASANPNSQSFGYGLGGFGGSATRPNVASQSFGGGLGFPGGFSGSSANAGAQSFGFGK